MKPQSLDVSIIIPSLRPKTLKKCIDRIYATTYKIAYEIVIVSPFRDILKSIEGTDVYSKTVFVLENKKTGSNNATNLAINYCQGKYIFTLADDQLIQTDCILNLYRFAENNIKDGLLLVGPRYTSLWGQHWDETVFDVYYPCNPFMHRDLLKELNYLIFDTMYKNYYGDPDLALRVRDLGYKVIPCGTAWMENSNAFDEVEEIRREEDFDKVLEEELTK